MQYRKWGFNPWVGKIPWRREWPPTPVFLPGKSHGQRSLAGYSPWGRKESDMTERLTVCWGIPWWLTSKEYTCNAGDPGSIPGSGRVPGERKGNSFQYSCLQNPMDRGAWGATAHGVTQSSTWLMWLSMHACKINKVLQCSTSSISYSNYNGKKWDKQCVYMCVCVYTYMYI